MKQFFLFFLLGSLFFPTDASAQTQKQHIIYGNDMFDLYANSDGSGLGKLNPNQFGQGFYLEKNWQDAAVYLTKKRKIVGYTVKYDLKSRVLELKTDMGIKVIPARDILRFDLINESGKRLFVNRQKTDSAYTGRTVFLEVLQAGKVTLLKQTEYSETKPNYSPQLMVGSKEPKPIRTVKFFVQIDGKFSPLPKRQKKALKLFGKHGAEIKSYLKKEALTFRSEAEVKKICAFSETIL